jgi:hypothetical protein
VAKPVRTRCLPTCDAASASEEPLHERPCSIDRPYHSTASTSQNLVEFLSATVLLSLDLVPGISDTEQVPTSLG